jgi:nucleotide-binding universal stress UspA family protein
MTDRTDPVAIPPARILVATDFSPASATARNYALGLAAPGAEIIFLHATVLPIPESAPQPEWMPDEPCPRDEVLDCLRRFSEPARRAGCAVSLVLEEGLPGEAILRAARARRVDLVAMGTHGRRGFERWVQGSTAQHVLRHCPVPVITVMPKGGPDVAHVQSVLCTVGSTDSVPTIGFAHELARSCNARLTCLHVVEPPLTSALNARGDLNAYYVAAEGRARARITAALRAVGADAAKLVITAGDAKTEIPRAAAIEDADLIVMGARDVHTAEGGFFGSTVERVVREVDCPVLTLRHAPSLMRPRDAHEASMTLG